jgi:hypothetical protein
MTEGLAGALGLGGAAAAGGPGDGTVGAGQVIGVDDSLGEPVIAAAW